MLRSAARRVWLVFVVVLSLVAGVVGQVLVAGLASAAPELPPGVPSGVPAPGVPARGASVGSLDGGLSVSPSGEASYGMPLSVPDGPGGLKPSLSLAYSSRAGNGVAGLGWSVTGATSSITRGGQTVASNGKTTGTHFRNSDTAVGDRDRFYLDGQQLVAASGYGASGTEYRTETESFTKVVSRDTDGLGPARFEVWLSNGGWREYTAWTATRYTSSASSLVSAGDVRFVWLVSKERDASGNELLFTYEKDTEQVPGGDAAARSVQILLKKISYSGGNRYVEFVYGARPDVELSWQSGVGRHLSKRLTEVQMWGPNPSATALLWRYNLDYELSAATKRSLMTSVTKCGFQGSCLSSKKFRYSRHETIFSHDTLDNLSEGVAERALQPADFDGDGADDLLYSTGDGAGPYVRMGQVAADGTVVPLATRYRLPDFPAYRSLVWTGSRPVDLDGDGIAEVFARAVAPGHPYLLHWNTAASRFEPGSSRGTFAMPTWGSGAWTGADLGEESDFGDFNGDGRLDLLIERPAAAGTSDLLVSFNVDGNHFADPVRWAAGDPNECRRTLLDTDGDGRIDIIDSELAGDCLSGTSGQLRRVRDDGAAESTAFSAGRYPLTGEFSDQRHVDIKFGDVNGDGLSDAVLWQPGGIPSAPDSTLSVRLNTGHGFAPSVQVSQLPVWPSPEFLDAPGLRSAALKMVDIDLDGKSDFVFFHREATEMPVGAWRGSDANYTGVTILYAGGGYQDLPAVAYPTRWYPVGGEEAVEDWPMSLFGDFNGDGRPDFVSHWTGSSSSELRVYTNWPGNHTVGRGQDLLFEVVDGANLAWPETRIHHESEWSRTPRLAGTLTRDFPTVSVRRRGMMVVRETESFAHVINPRNAAAVADAARKTRYAYEHPVMDVQGRGLLGFAQTFVWDMHRPTEVVTRYDNHTRVDTGGGRGYYPHAGRLMSQRTATAILLAAELKDRPARATVRVSETHYGYELRRPFGGLTYEVIANNSTLPSTNRVTNEWDQDAGIDWDLSNPANLAPKVHITGIVLDAPHSARKTVAASLTDEYGNVTRSQQRTQGGVTEDVSVQMDLRPVERVGAWQLHVPEHRSVTRIEHDDTTAVPHRTTRRLDFDHDPQGRVERVFTQPGSADPDEKSTTHITYTSKGALASVRTTADTAGVPERHTLYGYTPLVGPDEGIFPTLVWSPNTLLALRPYTWTMFHPGFGTPLWSIDANGAQTNTQIDDQGRPISVQAPGEDPIVVSYAARPDTGYAAGVSTGMITQTHRWKAIYTAGAPLPELQRVSTDPLGRVLTTENHGFDGALQATATSYDLLGRALTQTEPYRVGASTLIPFTRNTYDSLDRPRVRTNPDSTTVTQTHTFYETRTTDEKGNVTAVVRDVNDRPIRSIAVGGKTTPAGVPADVQTHFRHGPFDVLEKITDDAGKETRTTFDDLGRPIITVDPDAGTRLLRYNGFGEQLEVYHPDSGQARTSAYDRFGRPTGDTNYLVTGGGLRVQTGHSTLTYDSNTKGIGQLATTVSVDDVRTNHRYDTVGRPNGVDYTDGPTGAVYSVDTSYHPKNGLTESVTYPAMPDGTRVVTRNAYNEQAHLTEIGDATGGGYARLWLVDARTLRGQLAQATLGNNYITNRDYEPLTGRLKTITATRPATPSTPAQNVTNLGYEYWQHGQVKRRTDVGVRDETFDYDSMLRLSSTTLTHTATGISTTTVHKFAPTGNLEQVTRNGAITETNHYGNTSGNQPHTLTLNNRGGTLTGYGYDTQGRQTTGAGRTLTYTNLDILPNTITKDGRTWELRYDAFGNRFTKASGPDTTTYIADLAEKRVTLTTTTHAFHINGPDGNTTQLTYNGTNRTLDYNITDRLGSPTTTLTHTPTTDTTTVTRRHYTPYGQPATPDGTPLTTPPPGPVHTGFTGQENDPEYGLINYKGRLYDPKLKRFTTPDPIITNPLNSQTINPYSYVYNNPQNNTDPTGYQTHTPGALGGICVHACGNPDPAWCEANNPCTQSLPPPNQTTQPRHTTSSNGTTETASKSDNDTYNEPSAKPQSWLDKAGEWWRKPITYTKYETPPYGGYPASEAWKAVAEPTITSVQIANSELLMQLVEPRLTGIQGRPMDAQSLSQSGHGKATAIRSGGEANVINGHGATQSKVPFTVGPDSAVTTLRPGVELAPPYGHLIQLGDWETIGRLYEQKANEHWYSVHTGASMSARSTFDGAATHLPDATIPHHLMGPPVGLEIYQNSGSVSRITGIDEVVKPGSGHTVWCACTTEYK